MRRDALAANRQRLLQGLLHHPQLGLIVVLLVFGAIITAQTPYFLTTANIIQILLAAYFVVIIGVGTTFVFVTGGLDLSIGSVMGLSGIVCTWLMVQGASVPIAIVGGCLVGIFVGAVNGFITVYFHIPPLITTLGTLYIAEGAVTIISGGQTIGPTPGSFDQLGSWHVLGLPVLVIYAAVVALIGHVILNYTTFGYHARAVGGNRGAARALGIRVNRISMIVYSASGLSAALAGILFASEIASGQPSVGGTTNLEVIAAVIIGGTSLFGCIGTILGTIIGALLLSTINDGLSAIALNPAYQQVAVGVVVIAAVGLDYVRRSHLFRRRI